MTELAVFPVSDPLPLAQLRPSWQGARTAETVSQHQVVGLHLNAREPTPLKS